MGKTVQSSEATSVVQPGVDTEARWFGIKVLRYRGKTKAHAWYILQAIAYNLKKLPRLYVIGRHHYNHRRNAPSVPILTNESNCSRDFSKKMTKKYPAIHIKIGNCKKFGNSLNFAKASLN